MKITLHDAQIWQQQNAGRKSLCLCGTVAIGRFINVFAGEEKLVLGGLMHCGSPTACVTCSAKTALARVEVLQKVFLAASEQGLVISMVTLTLRHRKVDKLEDLLKAMSEAWKQLSADDMTVAARFAGCHWLRVLEVTDGKNGWHPHYHIAVIHKPEFDLMALADRWYVVWKRHLVAQGLKAPTYERGVNVILRMGLDAQANYLTKACGLSSLEFANGNHKEGRNGSRGVWQIHGEAVAGSEEAKKRWLQYEKAIKGQRTFMPTRKFASAFGLTWKTEKEIFDEVSVDSQELLGRRYYTFLGAISGDTWLRIVKMRKQKQFRFAARGGAESLRAWLRECFIDDGHRKRWVDGQLYSPEQMLVHSSLGGTHKFTKDWRDRDQETYEIELAEMYENAQEFLRAA